MPTGGYRLAETAFVASSAVLTRGTITPAAPASSARPIGVASFAATRTIPTARPPASMAVSAASIPE